MRVWSYSARREIDPDEATFDDFKLAVVSDTLDDWLGVYEVRWQANGWYPARPLSERLAIAECATAELLRDGLVELYRTESAEGAKSAVAPAEQREVLEAWETWAVP